jgi:hypothetical protein
MSRFWLWIFKKANDLAGSFACVHPMVVARVVPVRLDWHRKEYEQWKVVPSFWVTRYIRC